MTYTRDEIMAMSAEQLWVAIAEARGWTIIDVKGMVGVRDTSGLCAYERLPDWPTDIRAAWELVEELRREDYIEVYIEVKFNYYAVYIYSNEGDEEMNSLDLLAEAQAETAPLAICRAYLLYKQSA